jgi:hypothetical protein
VASFVRKILSGLLVSILLSQQADAMTAILVKRGASFLIVAADTRVTGSRGEIRDYAECKIQLLDKQSFFASAGVTSNKHGIPGELVFDTKKEAARVFQPSAELRDSADAWGDAMVSIYRSQPDSWKQPIISAIHALKIKDNMVTQGIFARADKNVDAWQVEIKHREAFSSVEFFRGTSVPITEDESAVSYYWGTTPAWEFIANLLRGDTPESASWRSAIAQEAIRRRYLRVDGYALELVDWR